MKKGQKAYSVKKGYENFFKKLEKPDYTLQNFLDEKTISGRINQAVKIATTDFMQLKSKFYELENQNKQLLIELDKAVEIFKTEKELQFKKSNFKNVKK